MYLRISLSCPNFALKLIKFNLYTFNYQTKYCESHLYLKIEICIRNSNHEEGQATQLKKTLSLPLKSVKITPETFHLPIVFPENGEKVQVDVIVK